MDQALAIKPCLFNCVIYCEKKERLDYCLDLLHTLASYFPCRLFVIHRLDESLKGQYTQSPDLYDKGADFYDTLFVEASADELYRVPFALFPFLVPELPIVLFWDCDPTQEQAVLPMIRNYANRLIFDSETVEPLFAFARRILESVDDEKKRLDLNWVRLSGWRELLAKAFDTQERLQHLRAASDVRFFYNARENRFFHHSQTQALYLQAWLAAEMQWEYQALEQQGELTKRIYRCDQETVCVTVQPLYVEQRAPGSLLFMEMVSRLGTEVSIDSRGLSGTARVKSVCDASCTLPYTLPLRGGRLNHRFFQQLLYQEAGSHYEAMLRELAKQE